MNAKKLSALPPDELRCIWMTAGILSYQLCDHNFECDDCPLDAAMRRQAPQHQPQRAGGGTGTGECVPHDCLREDRSYSPNHCWIKEMDPGIYRVGIEHGLATAFLTLKTIVFPAPGQAFLRGQACLWVVLEGGTFPLVAPLDGSIHATNHRLAAEPHLLRLESFDRGWLYEMIAGEPAQDAFGLVSAEQARAQFAEDESRFRASLAQALRAPHPQVGTTMADGGQLLQDLADRLGPTRYFYILRKRYSTSLGAKKHNEL